MNDFETSKRHNLGQVLLKVTRLYQQRAIAALHASGEPQLRESHLRLMPYLEFDHGKRQVNLAARLGITKQAVGALLSDMEAIGMVERIVDPKDRRARLVRLAPAAHERIGKGLAALTRIETDLRQVIGDDAVTAVHTGLLKILDALEAD